MGHRTRRFPTRPPLSYSIGPQIVVADFDGDGKSDLLAPYEGLVTLLLGNGDGTFQPPAYIFGSGGGPFTVGDLNRDGHLDIVGSYGTATVYVLLGAGNGTFSSSQTLTFPSEPGYFALADLNGDGKPDLLGSTAGALITAIGNGDGTFQPSISTAAAIIASSVVSTGDFNEDGKRDVLLPLAKATALLPGNGDGTFGPGRSILPGLGYTGLVVSDFNHDGHTDIAIQLYGQAAVRLLLGNGEATFQVLGDYPVADAIAGPSLYYGAQTLALGSFNSDGYPDVIAGGDQTAVASVLLGQADGQFLLPAQYPVNNPHSLVLADLNGDGRPDIITAGSGGAIELRLSNSTGGFSPPKYFAVETSLEALATGDFNGDGITDLVVGGADGVEVLLGKGDGSFHRSSYSSGSSTFAITSLTIGDFNGDGKQDVAVNYSEFPSGSFVSLFLGTGDGRLTPPTTVYIDSNGVAVYSADLNNDGKLDLVVLDVDHEGYAGVSVYLGNGDATFQPERYFDADAFAGSLAIADLNGDGIPDIAVSGAVDVSILIGKGDGSFQPYVPYRTAAGSGGLAVADFNLDGSPDLAVASGYESGVSFLLNNGDGTFQVGTKFMPSPSTYVHLAAGDVRGTGKPDLVIAGQTRTFVLKNKTQ